MEHVFHPPLREPVHAPTLAATCVTERDQFDSRHVLPSDSDAMRRVLKGWMPDGVLALKVEGREFVATLTLGDKTTVLRAYTAAQLTTRIIDAITDHALTHPKRASQEAA